MPDELKPCPFCGGEARVGLLGMTEKFMGLSDIERTRWFLRVQCLGCGTSYGHAERFPLLHGDMHTDPAIQEPAIAAWNRRTQEERNAG